MNQALRMAYYPDRKRGEGSLTILECLECRRSELVVVRATSLEVFKWRLEMRHESSLVLGPWVAPTGPFKSEFLCPWHTGDCQRKSKGHMECPEGWVRRAAGRLSGNCAGFSAKFDSET